MSPPPPPAPPDDDRPPTTAAADVETVDSDPPCVDEVGGEESVDLGRVAGTRLGRLGVSVIAAVLIVSVFGWNLPDGPAADDYKDTIRPLVNTLGLNQSWALFSPNPSSQSVRVWAEATFDDGSVEIYDFPGGDAVVGTYREYRWRKLERRVRLDRYRGIWRPTAEWVARELSSGDRQVVHIALHRDFSSTPAAGSGDPRVWETFEFFETEIRPEVDASAGAAGP